MKEKGRKVQHRIMVQMASLPLIFSLIYFKTE